MGFRKYFKKKDITNQLTEMASHNLLQDSARQLKFISQFNILYESFFKDRYESFIIKNNKDLLKRSKMIKKHDYIFQFFREFLKYIEKTDNIDQKYSLEKFLFYFSTSEYKANRTIYRNKYIEINLIMKKVLKDAKEKKSKLYILDKKGR